LRNLVAFLGSLPLGLALSGPAAGDYYSITDLKGSSGPPGGFIATSNMARAMNGAAQVAGTAGSVQQPYLYGGNAGAGAVTPVGLLGQSGFASAVNGAGQVVGGAGNGHAFLYSGGTTTDLGALSGTTGFSQAFAVNDSGQAVGLSNNPSVPGGSSFQPVLFTGGQVKALAAIGPGTLEGAARDISATGLIVGYSLLATGPFKLEHAVIWSASTGSVVADLGLGIALAVNASNQVVGSFTSPDGNQHAFIYSGGNMTDIGTLGGQNSQANSINSQGMVTGSISSSGLNDHGFLYSGGSMVDLNSLVSPGAGFMIERGNSINDAGQILVTARDQNRRFHNLILTPPGGVVPPDPFFLQPPPILLIPEPSSLALLGLGSLIGLPGLWRARRRRRDAGETERPPALELSGRGP
jgi:probable HAF family extracellular repeat protein